MNRHSCLTDISSLYQWFSGLDIPAYTWNLYRGFWNKMPVNAIAKQTNDQLSVEESWALMEQHIMANSANGGQFTIYVPAPGGKGYVQHVSINMQPGGGYGSQVAGLGGMQSHPMALGYLPADEVDRRIAKERESWEMQKRIEDLEAEREYKSTWQDILMAKLMEIDPNQINLGGLFQQFLQPKPGVQLRGMANEMQPPVAEAPEGEGQPFHYDADRLIPAVDLMRQHFGSDEEFIIAFEKFAATFDANPDFFKQQLM